MSSTGTAEPLQLSVAKRVASHEPPLLVVRPGIVEYQQAWDLQVQLAELRRQKRIPDILLLLEHPHTVTLGRRGHDANVLLSERALKRRGISVHRADRGGDVTYHGPGQLVGYLILQLPPGPGQFLRYLRDLEAAIVNAVCDLGVRAERKEDLTGVWVEDDKLCAIGVKVDAARTTRHGFALNIDPDLSYFSHIVPCGLTGKGVTSLRNLLGTTPSRRRVETAVIQRLSETFGLRARSVGPKRLRELLEPCTLEE